MAAPSSQKIQLFGHSFVRRLKRFIVDSKSHNFHLHLDGCPLIQYSGFPGATVRSLRDHLDEVVDFQPNILVLVIGTNDIFNSKESPESVTTHICDLVDTFLFVIGVEKVIVFQTLHRLDSMGQSRYQVDSAWFNERVDNLNMLLTDRLNSTDHRRSYLWKLKGFWSTECKARNFAADGCHLSPTGQLRFIGNIRAAIVAAWKKSIC